MAGGERGLEPLRLQPFWNRRSRLVAVVNSAAQDIPGLFQGKVYLHFEMTPLPAAG